MIKLGEIMHGESRYSFMAYDGEKVAITLKTLMQTGGFVRVHEREGEIDGGMVGYVAAAWFSSDIVASELALFVRPDRRGGIAASRLIAEFVTWATERGAREAIMAINTGVKVLETAALYRHSGFNEIGGIFQRRLCHVL